LKQRSICAAAALAFASGLAALPAYSLSYTCSAPNVQTTFAPTAGDGSQTDGSQPFAYTVPAGVSSVTVDAGGAQAGFGSGTAGPFGAEVAATMPVTPGDVLCVIAGVRGQDALSLGGGGGGSFVYRIATGTCASNLPSVSTGSTAPNLLVAAGGGGGSFGGSAGTPGRATGLGAGTAGAIDGDPGVGGGGAGGTGGNGGGGNAGGGGNGLLTNGTNGSVCTGGQSLRNGAAGGSCSVGAAGRGGFGGGGGAGGGGGYSGGGASTGGSGGGGGGSYSIVTPIAANTQDGASSPAGAVSICANLPAGNQTYSAPSPTGTGTITASFTGGGAACTFTTSRFIPVTGDPSSPPGTAPADFPHGLFDFTLGSCIPGSTVTMTIAYPSTLAAHTQYFKYGPEPATPAAHWYVLPATIAGSTVTFSITDGGQGDDDLAANGGIVDQGGPGVPPATDVPTLSAWAMAALVSLLLLFAARRFRAPTRR
jgi:hypothetical protein